MEERRLFRWGIIFLLIIGALSVVPTALSQANPAPTPAAETESLAAALTPQAWERVEKSIDHGLEWLARQQNDDGSFEAPGNGQPGITGLAVMAFLSKGHMPGVGPYGEQLNKAIDFTLRCQRADGLFSYHDAGSLSGGGGRGSAGKSATYNHGIAGLMLTEVYGMTDEVRAERIRNAVSKALQCTRKIQTRPKSYSEDLGGWRYLYQSSSSADSDLSATGWQLMFYRSAKNAEFDVPRQHMDEAIRYVLGCWNEQQKVFYYTTVSGDRRWSRGMVGVGVLSLSLAGQHQTRIAREAGDWMLRYPFDRYQQVGQGERFYYSTYYCSQAMAQLGGHHWKQFFPSLANTLVRQQRSSGAWPSEPLGSDGQFGAAYTTSLAILSLTPPLQLLPVYQR